jgi:HSP20 family protein
MLTTFGFVSCWPRLLTDQTLPGAYAELAGVVWKRQRRNELAEGEAIRVERPKGAFSRVFKFPCPVDEERIQAEFKKGVLRVTVPKSSPGCRTHRIEVREVE